MFSTQELILFCLAATGMTLIIVQGSIFEPLREILARKVEKLEQNRKEKNLSRKFTILESIHKILHCLQCTGFWCGIFCGFFLLTSDVLMSGYTMQITQTSANFNNWLPLFNNIKIVRWIMLLFCCGLTGSFLAPLGDLLLQWIYIAKELMTKQLIPDSHNNDNDNNNN